MTLTNDDLDVLSTRAAQCMGSTVEIDRVDLAALVAEVRASRQHASGGEDVLTDALDLLNLYHDALDDATAGGFSVEILRSMGNGGDVWRLMRERRLAGPPATRTHKAGTIEIDDGWYTGNCACGWRAIAQRLRRVDALKDADAHVRVASEVAPSPPAPVKVAPTAPDAFPRAPRDAAEREAVAAVPFGDDWCFALSPVGLSCARAPGHAGDHVASEDFEHVIARWPAAPATTGGEGGK